RGDDQRYLRQPDLRHQFRHPRVQSGRRGPLELEDGHVHRRQQGEAGARHVCRRRRDARLPGAAPGRGGGGPGGVLRHDPAELRAHFPRGRRFHRCHHGVAETGAGGARTTFGLFRGDLTAFAPSMRTPSASHWVSFFVAPTMVRGLVMLLLVLVSPALPAADDYLQQLVAQARARGLAQHPQWRALLHYEPRLLLPGVESLADDPAFFNAPEGKTDPEQELAATLAAFFEPPEESEA